MEGKGITLPAIALRGLTILPEMIQHFDISREKSVGALESAMVGEQKVFLVTQRHPEEEDPDLGNFYDYFFDGDGSGGFFGGSGPLF